VTKNAQLAKAILKHVKNVLPTESLRHCHQKEISRFCVCAQMAFSRMKQQSNVSNAMQVASSVRMVKNA
jgi:hypothetical protein